MTFICKSGEYQTSSTHLNRPLIADLSGGDGDRGARAVRENPLDRLGAQLFRGWFGRHESCAEGNQTDASADVRITHLGRCENSRARDFEIAELYR